VVQNGSAPRGWNSRRLLDHSLFVHIRISCEFRRKVIVSATNCAKSDKTVDIVLSK
jgi:hypothetical protein